MNFEKINGWRAAGTRAAALGPLFMRGVVLGWHVKGSKIGHFDRRPVALLLVGEGLFFSFLPGGRRALGYSNLP